MWQDLLNGFYGYFVEEFEGCRAKRWKYIKRMSKRQMRSAICAGAPLLLSGASSAAFLPRSAYNKKDKSSCTFYQGEHGGQAGYEPRPRRRRWASRKSTAITAGG